MGAIGQRLLTLEEFLRLPGNEHLELVRGEVVQSGPFSARHGGIVVAVGSLLLEWAKCHVDGSVGVRAGFVLARDPDTVRGVDVWYMSAARKLADDDSNHFWTIAPDLAVEVVEIYDRDEEVREKVSNLFAIGTSLVWIVHIDTQEVVVHTPDGLSRAYGGDDVIEYPEILPGFSCKVSEIFS